MEYRIEHDTLGEVKVPADHKWGAQTQRSFENFKIGKNKIPEDIIRAFAILKKCAAIANKPENYQSKSRRLFVRFVTKSLRESGKKNFHLLYIRPDPVHRAI